MNALETRVLELIGENPDDPDVYTDDDTGMAPIRDSINDAISEILMITGGFKRQYFIPLREETTFYRFALDNGELGWITDVWLVNQQRRLEQTDLVRLNAHDPRWLISTGTPHAYCSIGQDIIGVYPKPSASSDVIEITIAEMPFNYLTDLDRVKLRDSFKFATIHYAVSEYWAARGDANESTAHMKLYMDALGIGETYTQTGDWSPNLQTQKENWPKATS